MFMSYITCCVALKFRSIVDRAHACSFLKKLIFKILSTTHMCLQHKRIGDDQWVELRVGSDGMVPGNLIWTEEFYNEHVALEWASDSGNLQKPWIKSDSDFSVPCQLVEFLTFVLDPKHPTLVNQDLDFRAFCLISQITNTLDAHADDISAPIDTDMKSGRVKTDKRRLSNSEVWAGAVILANIMWAGTDFHLNYF